MAANDIAASSPSKVDKVPEPNKVSAPKSRRVTILCAARVDKLRTHGTFSYQRPTTETLRGKSKLFTIFGAGVHTLDRDDWEWLQGFHEDRDGRQVANDNHGLIVTGQVFLILDGLHIYRDAIKIRTISGGSIPREEWIKQCYDPAILTIWRDQIAGMTAEEFKIYSDYSERRSQIEKRLKEAEEGKIIPPRHPSFGDDTGLASFF